MDTKLTAVVAETLTAVTGALTQASNAPKGAVGMEPTGSATYWQFTPRLKSALWDNDGVFTSHDAALSERGLTNFAEIDSFAVTDDAFYVGCDVPFRGMYVNIKAPNGTASIATWNYWNGSAWADLSDTDATAAAGATLAVDDIVTWAVPAAWARVSVNGGPPLFYAQLVVSATLDSDTQIAEVIPLPVQTAGPAPNAVTTGGPPPRYFFNRDSVGGVEVTGLNTETLAANWLVAGGPPVFIAE